MAIREAPWKSAIVRRFIALISVDALVVTMRRLKIVFMVDAIAAI
jgi:hypothetical protein